MKKLIPERRIYGTVKVSERGQIVIPAKARRDYEIKSGDLLLVLGGPFKRGLGLIKTEHVKSFVEKLLQGLNENEEAKSE